MLAALRPSLEVLSPATAAEALRQGLTAAILAASIEPSNAEPNHRVAVRGIAVDAVRGGRPLVSIQVPFASYHGSHTGPSNGIKAVDAIAQRLAMETGSDIHPLPDEIANHYGHVLHSGDPSDDLAFTVYTDRSRVDNYPLPLREVVEAADSNMIIGIGGLADFIHRARLSFFSNLDGEKPGVLGVVRAWTPRPFWIWKGMQHSHINTPITDGTADMSLVVWRNYHRVKPPTPPVVLAADTPVPGRQRAE